ncbi:MAG: hypothetical protein IPM38_17590 [Ignavibacteria bacterium]|nr:hypothetical protein [Ignavibacteria bacterium]
MKTNAATANILTTILKRTVLKNPLPLSVKAFVIIKLPAITFTKLISHPRSKGKE